MGTEVNNARFDTSCTKVSVQVDSKWSDIGGGWKLKPESNPKVLV